MEGEIDFDPFSAEGQEDINDMGDDEYESILPQEDETRLRWYERIHSSYGSNTNSVISRARDIFKIKNPRSSVPVYMQMRENYQTYRTPQYEMIAEITSDLKEKRPNVDLSLLDFKVNEKGRAMVKHVTGKKWYFLYNSKTGDFLKSMPKNIQDALGDPPLREQKEVIEEREEIEMKELKEAREDAISDAVASDDPELRFAGNYIRDLVALKKDSKNQVLRLLKKVIDLRIDETKDAVEELMRNSIDKLKNMSKEAKTKVSDLFEMVERNHAKDKRLREASKKLSDGLENMSKESKRKTGEFFERAQRDNAKGQFLREASKKLSDGLENMSKESKKKFLVFMKNIEELRGEEGKEVIIEEMTNFYDEMEEEIDRLKEELEDSRNFNINRMTQPEWADGIRELEDELENKEAEVKELKESMAKAEEMYKKKNEEVIKAQRHEFLVSQERIKALIEDREDARKDYIKLKKRYDNMKQQLDSVTKSFRDELQRHGVNLDRLKETEAVLNKTREEKEELQRKVALKEQQLRDMEQTIEELEKDIEQLRESMYSDKTPAEREEIMRQVDKRLKKLEELRKQQDKLERELGLTGREKIIRYLKRAGMGIAAAGAIASIITLIMNAFNRAGAAVKKVGTQAANLGKKMAAAIPGLLGSVLSLIFRTGGELLKFLGNNIWILVVAVGAVVLKSLTDKR